MRCHLCAPSRAKKAYKNLKQRKNVGLHNHCLLLTMTPSTGTLVIFVIVLQRLRHFERVFFVD